MWPGRCWMYSVGSLKLQFIPTAQFCSKQRWSLPLQFHIWGTQGDETTGYYTSNSKVPNKGIQANLGCVWLVETNKWTLPCLFIFLLLKRHWITQDKESAAFPSWNGPKLYSSWTGPTLGSCGTPFLYLFKVYISSMTVTSLNDVMIICFFI